MIFNGCHWRPAARRVMIRSMEDEPESESTIEFRRALVRDLFFEAFSNQAQYGRWVVASLLAVHGGSLIAIAQSGDASKALFSASGAYILWGIVAALVSGGLAWINFTAAMWFYAAALKKVRDGPVRREGFAAVVARITVFLTPAVAIGSLGLFVAAVRSALVTLQPPG